MIMRIVSVRTDPLGSFLAQAASAGATTIYPQSVSEFLESGTLSIGTETVAYTRVIEDDTERLDLGSALTGDYEEEEPVSLIPEAYRKTATVTDGENEHNFDVSSAIWHQLPNGPRDDGAGEYVIVEGGRIVSLSGKTPEEVIGGSGPESSAISIRDYFDNELARIDRNGILFVPEHRGWDKATTGGFYSFTASGQISTMDGTGDLRAHYYRGLKIRVLEMGGAQYKYFFIVDVSYDSLNDRTTLTLYGGTDYALTPGFVDQDTWISRDKCPAGFPLNPDKWTIEVINASSYQQSSPVNGTWYNLGSLSIAVPAGAWHLSYRVYRYIDKSGSSLTVQSASTLATTNNGITHSEFTTDSHAGEGNNCRIGVTSTASECVEQATATTWYLNHRTTTDSANVLLIGGSYRRTILRAVCAYL